MLKILALVLKERTTTGTGLWLITEMILLKEKNRWMSCPVNLNHTGNSLSLKKPRTMLIASPCSSLKQNEFLSPRHKSHSPGCMAGTGNNHLQLALLRLFKHDRDILFLNKFWCPSTSLRAVNLSNGRSITSRRIEATLKRDPRTPRLKKL